MSVCKVPFGVAHLKHRFPNKIGFVASEQIDKQSRTDSIQDADNQNVLQMVGIFADNGCLHNNLASFFLPNAYYISEL